MMTPLAMILAVNWLTFCWHFLGVIVVLLCVFLTAIILMQDSKGAGLTSAFGAGPGGESLLGARMQKDVARWTAITAGIFGVLVLIMGLLGTYIYRYGTVGAAGVKSPPAAESPAPGPESGLPGGPLPGLTPENPPAKTEVPQPPSGSAAPAPAGSTPPSSSAPAVPPPAGNPGGAPAAPPPQTPPPPSGSAPPGGTGGTSTPAPPAPVPAPAPAPPPADEKK
jgi:protein translocase SecG subunit